MYALCACIFDLHSSGLDPSSKTPLNPYKLQSRVHHQESNWGGPELTLKGPTVYQFRSSRVEVNSTVRSTVLLPPAWGNCNCFGPESKCYDPFCNWERILGKLSLVTFSIHSTAFSEVRSFCVEEYWVVRMSCKRKGLFSCWYCSTLPILCNKGKKL